MKSLESILPERFLVRRDASPGHVARFPVTQTALRVRVDACLLNPSRKPRRLLDRVCALLSDFRVQILYEPVVLRSIRCGTLELEGFYKVSFLHGMKKSKK